MSTDVQSTDYSNKAFESVKSYTDKVNQEKADKKAAYEASMQSLDVYTQLKNKAMSKFKSAKSLFQQGKNTSEYNASKAEYTTACNSFTDAENNSDIKRSSYQTSIFYAAKINNATSL